MENKFREIAKKWRLENSLKAGSQNNVWRFDRKKEIDVDERNTSIDKVAFQFAPTLSLIYACGIYFDDTRKGDFLVSLIKEEINNLFFVDKTSRPNQSLAFFLPFLVFNYHSRSGNQYIIECRHDKFRLEFPDSTSLNIRREES